MLRYSLPVSLLLSLLFVNAFATTNLNYKFKKTFQSTAGVVALIMNLMLQTEQETVRNATVL